MHETRHALFKHRLLGLLSDACVVLATLSLVVTWAHPSDAGVATAFFLGAAAALQVARKLRWRRALLVCALALWSIGAVVASTAAPRQPRLSAGSYEGAGARSVAP